MSQDARDPVTSGSAAVNEAGSRDEKGRCPVVRVTLDTLPDIQRVFRSPAVEENADVSADNYVCPNALAEINAKEFQEGNLAMINGTLHRERRRMLNALVRPEELIRFRDHIILPSVERWLSRSVKKSSDGSYSCDLAAVVELIFLEFAAKIIGLQGVESEEGMAKLRSCVLPIFGGLSASHFENREAVTRAGIEAKKIFVNEYFWPSLEYTRRQLARVESGEISADSVPLNLLRLIATQAHDSYKDEDVAIREAILFFVATTGTSTQAVLSTIDFLLGWFENHPQDISRIDDMEFISNALQEALRLRAPFVSYLTRLAVDDLHIPNVDINAGDEIHAWLARAGRDAQIFGLDADEFDPNRKVPEGVNRYALAFGAGPHQCLGLRAVLGNDGRSGSHLRMVQGLFKAGVRRDPQRPPRVLEMKRSERRDEIPTYISYPVLLTNWKLTS